MVIMQNEWPHKIEDIIILQNLQNECCYEIKVSVRWDIYNNNNNILAGAWQERFIIAPLSHIT